MDESSRLILAESAVTAANEPARRRFFSRRRKAQPPPLPYCENCLAPMTGPFCARCGQHAIDYRRSFSRFFGDVLDSFLNWDSKLFATMALLCTRPWQLTNSFLHGRRVRYVHPLRVYLLISVIFFFGVHELAQHTDFGRDRARPKNVSEAQKKIDAIFDVRDAGAAATIKKGPLLFEMDDESKNSSDGGFDKWINSRIKEKIGENGVNAKVFFLTVISNLPAMMLCCIPLFALVLKILYLRRGFFFIDHLIYALHIHAFAYLAILVIGFVIAKGPDEIPNITPWLIAALILVALGLLLLSIRRVYRQGWCWSVFKFMLGGAIYLTVLSVALGATFFVTLALPN